MRKRSKPTLGLSLRSTTCKERHAPIKDNDTEKEQEEQIVVVVPQGAVVHAEQHISSPSMLPSSPRSPRNKHRPSGYLKVTIENCVTDKVDDEKPRACNMIREALALREKYVFQPNIHPWEHPDKDVPLDPWKTDDIPSTPSSHIFKIEHGVICVYQNQQGQYLVFLSFPCFFLYTSSFDLLQLYTTKVFFANNSFVQQRQKRASLSTALLPCLNFRKIMEGYWISSTPDP